MPNTASWRDEMLNEHGDRCANPEGEMPVPWKRNLTDCRNGTDGDALVDPSRTRCGSVAHVVAPQRPL